MAKASKKLPDIPKLDVNYLLLRADGREVLTTMESAANDTGYVISPDGVMILTREKGFIYIDADDINTVAEEIEYIREYIEQWSEGSDE